MTELQFKERIAESNKAFEDAVLDVLRRHDVLPQATEVGKGCVGLIVKVPEDSYFDIEFTKKVFEKKFPGLPIVYQYGLDVQMVYADDDAFKNAVLDVLRMHPEELMKIVLNAPANGGLPQAGETYGEPRIKKDDHPRYAKTCEADKAKFDDAVKSLDATTLQWEETSGKDIKFRQLIGVKIALEGDAAMEFFKKRNSE